MSTRSTLNVFRRSRQRFSWVMALFLGFAGTGAISADSLQPVSLEGTTDLTLTMSSGHVIHTSIRQTNVGGALPYKDALLWGGDMGHPPQTALSAINVEDGGSQIPIPLSAYSDLGDVKWASLKLTKNGYSLHLHGGETGTAYDAELSFAHGLLQTRVVRLREFPDQRWEKTGYSFTTGN